MSPENIEPAPLQTSSSAKPETGTQVRKRQKRVGTVSSAKMQKTITVKVDRSISHWLYRRIVRRSTKFLVHDEKNEARVGDRVEIEETRPLSRRKRWRLKKILARAIQ